MIGDLQRSPRPEVTAAGVPAPRCASPLEALPVTPGPAAPPRDTRRARRALVPVVVNLALLSALVALLGLAVGPHTGEYRTLTMLTGSMRPHFPAGSVVVVTPQRVEDLRVGQVITFHAPTPDRRVVTHRVLRIDRSGAKPVVETKGDANAGPDPWRATLAEPVVWRARFAVPVLGDAIVALRDPRVQLATTRVLPVALLAWLLWAVWRTDEPDA